MFLLPNLGAAATAGLQADLSRAVPFQDAGESGLCSSRLLECMSFPLVFYA